MMMNNNNAFIPIEDNFDGLKVNRNFGLSKGASTCVTYCMGCFALFMLFPITLYFLYYDEETKGAIYPMLGFFLFFAGLAVFLYINKKRTVYGWESIVFTPTAVSFRDTSGVSIRDIQLSDIKELKMVSSAMRQQVGKYTSRKIGYQLVAVFTLNSGAKALTGQVWLLQTHEDVKNMVLSLQNALESRGLGEINSKIIYKPAKIS